MLIGTGKPRRQRETISVFVLGNMCNGVPFLLGRMVSHGSWAHAKRACASKDKFGVPCRCAFKKTWRAPLTTRCSSMLENVVRAALRVSLSDKRVQIPVILKSEPQYASKCVSKRLACAGLY